MGAAIWLLVTVLAVWSATRMAQGLLRGEAQCGPRKVALDSAPRLYWLTVGVDILAFLLAVGVIASQAAHVAPIA
jgi:hypothetical protein